MPTTHRAYDLGFRSLDETDEHRDHRLDVEGTVPAWLSGVLIRNGPARFDVGGERATHWFDGLAMLRRYGFDDGTVAYTNRFLRTEAYEDADRGATAGEFGTTGGLLEQARTPLPHAVPFGFHGRFFPACDR